MNTSATQTRGRFFLAMNSDWVDIEVRCSANKYSALLIVTVQCSQAPQIKLPDMASTTLLLLKANYTILPERNWQLGGSKQSEGILRGITMTFAILGTLG